MTIRDGGCEPRGLDLEVSARVSLLATAARTSVVELML